MDAILSAKDGAFGAVKQGSRFPSPRIPDDTHHQYHDPGMHTKPL